MKKLEVHIYPNKESRGKTVTFSVRKVIIYFVLTVCAILGFIMFSPVQIVENLSNGNLMDVYHQNSVIKNEIKKIRTVVDTTILKIEETRIVRDSTLKLGGRSRLYARKRRRRRSSEKEFACNEVDVP